MSDTLRDLLRQQGPNAVLNAYGLDEVLTDQDDPYLWAAVLLRHWPAPNDPDMYPASLRFGIGRIVREGDGVDAASTRSGMDEIEVWCFERIDPDHLRVKACGDQAPLTMGTMMTAIMAGKDFGQVVTAPEVSLSQTYLDISRPSRTEKRALIHSGVSAFPSAGTGETRYWERQGGGHWAETEEVISRWLT